MAISKIKSDSIDTIAATKLTGTVDNARITLDAAEVPNLDASKITTGNISNARVPASAVTQHVTATNLTPIENDLAILALQNAINSNITAHGLQNSWIEQFEDSNSITGLTNCLRNSASEYVSSDTNGSATLWPYTNFTDQVFTHSSGWVDDGAAGPQAQIANSTMHTTAKNNNSGAPLMGYVAGPTGYVNTFSIDYKASYLWSKLQIGFRNYNGLIKTWRIEKSDDGSAWTVVDQTGSTASALPSTKTNFTSPNNNLSVGADGVITNVTNNGNGAQHGGTLTFGTSFTARHLRFSIGSHVANGNTNSALHFFEPYYNPVITNATGSFTSTTITPQDSANKSSIGLVVLYKEQAGSTTLNTHLVAKVRANASQAYQTVTLANKGTFSTGIKIAIAPAISVTAGQELSYEISFAGQSSGSLETQVHGVALQY